MPYVFVQFSSIIYLSLNANLNNLNLTIFILLLISISVAGVALFNMKLNNLNILPDLKENHLLITRGIYRFIRHPMYTAVLLLCLALLLTNPHLLAYIVMMILLVNLILKSNLEEKNLTKRFHSYQDYQKITGRFLPFL
jgi:protein-S-isoprenylcysteine O-methyltransferase Ste14